MSLLFTQSFKEGIFEVYNEKPKHLELIEVEQTHSHNISDFDQTPFQYHNSDGIMIDLGSISNHSLVIRTADCLPVLFIGSRVALIHAGWRGLADNILTNKKLKGIDTHTILIGPSIYKYEVQENFKENFPKSEHFYKENGVLYFNLQAFAKQKLQENFPNAKIIDSKVCTLENISYNSYRRDKTTKRNWNIFRKHKD